MLHALFRILEGLQCRSVLAFKDQCHLFYFRCIPKPVHRSKRWRVDNRVLREVGTVGALPGLSPVPVQHHYIKWEGKEEYYFCQSRKCQKDPSSKFM